MCVERTPRRQPSHLLPLLLFALLLMGATAIQPAMLPPPLPVQAPRSPPGPASGQRRPNCTRLASGAPLASPVGGSLFPGHVHFNRHPSAPASAVNCTDSITRVKIDAHGYEWRTHVIIACTVMATVEVIIVIVMVIYWQQIRWVLRKIACPCDNGRRASEQGELLESGSAERDSAAASEDTSGPVVSLITSTSEGQSLTGVVIGGTPRAVDDDITVNNHL